MKRSIRNLYTLAGASMLELYRRKDVYTAIILALVITVPLAGVHIFGFKGIVRYLREIMLLLIWLFSIVIGLTTAARQIPGEIERRTIYPLLARPVRRGEFVVGKFLGAWSATASAILLFYVCYILLVGFKEGEWVTPVLVQAVVFHLIFAALMVALTIFGSTFLTPSANVTISALLTASMLLFGIRIPDAAVQLAFPGNMILWSAHMVLPHFEFFDLRLRVIHSWGPVAAPAFLGVVAYGIAYSAVLLSAAVWVFSRKRL